MPYVKPIKPNGPIGVNPTLKEDRMPVIHVTNGDSWTVDASLFNPSNFEPADVKTCEAEFLLTENRFACEILWRGTWFEGIYPDDVIPGLVHVKIPREVSGELRRGSYQFSLKVTDYLDKVSMTELIGYFLVEYEPTSDTHNIPYRHYKHGCECDVQKPEDTEAKAKQQA